MDAWDSTNKMLTYKVLIFFSFVILQSARQVGAYQYEKAASGGVAGPGGPFEGGFGNPFEDFFGGGGMNDFFKNIFRDIEFDGQDVKVSLEISFMEAVPGFPKNVNFHAFVPCESCGGLTYLLEQNLKLVGLVGVQDRYSSKLGPLGCRARARNVVVQGKL